MVIAMVVIAITASMVAVFVQLPVRGYADARARAEVVDVADNAMRLMTRDIRLALPNSLRISGNAVEVLQVKTGDRYLAAEDAHLTLQHLDFHDATKTSFVAVGSMPTGKAAITSNDYVVVNNLGELFVPGDAYRAAGKNRAKVSGITYLDANSYRITMESNPFATQTIPIPSPTSRFHVVSGPVSYVCSPSAGGGTLKRYSGYGIIESQPTSESTLGAGSLVANNVTACAFTYTSVNARIALLSMSLTIKLTNSSDTVTLTHQIHF
jgi:MSHA biogenesis protein MshO